MTLETLDTPGTALAPITPPDTDSWVEVVGQVAKLAAHIADTEFVPKGLRGSAAAVTAAILYGREIGLPPMTALTQVHVVEGRPGLAAEGMRALILAAGHDFEVVDATGASATVRGRRRGSGRWAPVVWNLDMARAAGLIKEKSNWVKYPRAMLVARATVELARQLFPDVIHGFRALEELADDPGTPDEAPAQIEGPTTTVRRTPRAPRKAAAPKVDLPPTEGSDRPTPPPPLPGEDGYSETPTIGDGSPPPADPPVVGPDTSTGEEAPRLAEAPVEAEPDVVEAEIVDTPETTDEIEVVEDREPRARGVDIQAVRLTFEKKLGVADRDTRLAYVSAIIGREIDTTTALTRREAGTILDTLGYCNTTTDLDNAVSAAVAHREATEGTDTP
jgi:hypothetical protein